MTLDHHLLLNKLARLQKTITYACDHRIKGWEQYRGITETAIEAIKTLSTANDNYAKTMATIDLAAQQDAATRVAMFEALAPFAACVDQIPEDESDEEWAKFRLLVKDFRRAKAAMQVTS